LGLLANIPADKYRSPLSQIIATITPFSRVFASLTAAAILAPLLTPVKIPYYFANLLIIVSDSYSVASIT